MINRPVEKSICFYRFSFLLCLILLLIQTRGQSQQYLYNFESGLKKPPWTLDGQYQSVSQDFSLSGKKSFRAYLPAKTYSNPRSEIRWTGGGTGTPNHHPHFSTWGIKLAIYFPKNFQPDKTSVESIFQFLSVKDKGDTYTNPPFMVRLNNNSFTITNRWISKKLASKADQHTKTWNISKNVVPGKWHYFVMDIHWDYREGGNGFLKVYMNIGSPASKGNLVVNYKGPTGYNDQLGAYFKMGIYKWDWKDPKRVSLSKNAGVTQRLLYYDDYEIKKGGFYSGSGGSTANNEESIPTMAGNDEDIYFTQAEDEFPSDLLPYFSIYPNPVSDEVTFEMYLEASERIDLNLYDSLGKLYHLGHLEVPSGHSKFSYNIRETNLSPGIYYLKLNSPQLDNNPKKIAITY